MAEDANAIRARENGRTTAAAKSSLSENYGTISGLLCTAISGGTVIPPIVGWAGDNFGMHVAMLVPALCLAYVLG